MDSLVVGESPRSWIGFAEWDATSRVTVTADSVHRWDVGVHQNLAPGMGERGGSITGTYAADDSTAFSGAIPGLERLVDGDPGTAFDPDEVSEVPRDLTIDIDLGGSFSVDDIRLHPRLDPERREFYPQCFEVRSADEAGAGARAYVAVSGLWFSHAWPNREPVVHASFESRDMRYLQLRVCESRPWELAELEIYSDGTVPTGTYQSKPLTLWHAYPVWGRVRCDGTSVEHLPISVHTRTGPDRYPVLHYRLTGVGDEVELVSPTQWLTLFPEERGPRRPNPEWSSWEAVADGVVRSPGLEPWFQFRIRMPESGTVIRRMVFEYVFPPIAHELRGEIDPRMVKPGEEQAFVLSLVAYFRGGKTSSVASTGFRQLQVITDAEIRGIDEVLVDDLPALHVARLTDNGFTVSLGKRILQDGTFVQIRFRAAVFRDGTRFETRVLDRRAEGGQVREAYQLAWADDIDPVSAGGALNVRFSTEAARDSLIANARATPAVFTPNGDGANDFCDISFDLLTLTRPGSVRFTVHDLSGHCRRLLYAGDEVAGHVSHLWDGRDDSGRLVAPGIYVYRLEVAAQDQGDGRSGVVLVAY